MDGAVALVASLSLRHKLENRCDRDNKTARFHSSRLLDHEARQGNSNNNIIIMLPIPVDVFLLLLYGCILSQTFAALYTNTAEWLSVLPDTDLVISLPVWNVSSADDAYQNLSSSVPGDLLSDLMKSGVIQDPYYDRNFLTQRRVWMGPLAPGSKNTTSSEGEERTRTWIYSAFFEVDSYKGTRHLALVAESIKMGAIIQLNGVEIGVTNDQFLRYIFDLPNNALERGTWLSETSQLHEIKIRFDPTISTNGRFMACSGGWDWAPYSHSVDTHGSRTFTLGIPQPIYIAASRKAIVTDVVPKIYYMGPYPSEPLWAGPRADFLVSLETHISVIDADALQKYSIIVTADFLEQPVIVPFNVYDGKMMTINITASRNRVGLWWPNGMGAQNLHSLRVTLNDGSSNERANIYSLHRRVGFRTVALVTANDTDPSTLSDMTETLKEGSGLHGMYFRINGAIIWARGANLVPMDQLEARLSDEGHRELVRSAAKANMNMIRVWGGGSIPPKAFYDACDEAGILLYHDLMFVEEGYHGAVETNTVRDEIVHTVRKLMPHPSVAIWNGCNECTLATTAIYESFVLRTVAQEDDTRPIWANSPLSHGWKSGVKMLDGHPNGKPLKVRVLPNSSRYDDIEMHGPYQRGYSVSYPAVNGRKATNSNETLVPPVLSRQSKIGPGFHNTFISEFGASMYSSFESMSALLPISAWGIHGGESPDECTQVVENANTCRGRNAIAERNYPCDNRIQLYFENTVSLDAVGPIAFQRQLYECVMAQTLWMKGRLEMIRSDNSFGALIWQLNENWPTGGWGSVEYGPRRNMTNQVVGGRWKPLMYLLRRHLFRDVIVSCGQDDVCFARNDGYNSTDLLVNMEAWELGGDEPLRNASLLHALPQGRSSVDFHLPQLFRVGADVIMIEVKASLQPSSEGSREAFLWNLPRDLSRLAHPVTISIATQQEEHNGNILIQLTSNSLALYVFLSTTAEGQFTENAFHLLPRESKVLSFEKVPSAKTVDFALLRATFRVDHLGPKTILQHIPPKFISSTF